MEKKALEARNGERVLVSYHPSCEYIVGVATDLVISRFYVVHVLVSKDYMYLCDALHTGTRGVKSTKSAFCKIFYSKFTLKRDI